VKGERHARGNYLQMDYCIQRLRGDSESVWGVQMLPETVSRFNFPRAFNRQSEASSDFECLPKVTS
jgi:hypothetical protein